MKLLSFPERQELAAQTVSFERLGLDPESQELTFAKFAPDRLLIMSVDIEGKSFKESYETYYDTLAKEKAYYDLTDYEVKPLAKTNSALVVK